MYLTHLYIPESRIIGRQFKPLDHSSWQISETSAPFQDLHENTHKEEKGTTNLRRTESQAIVLFLLTFPSPDLFVLKVFICFREVKGVERHVRMAFSVTVCCFFSLPCATATQVDSIRKTDSPYHSSQGCYQCFGIQHISTMAEPRRMGQYTHTS